MIRELGGKIMGVCSNCAKLVRIDKPVFGSFHIYQDAQRNNGKRVGIGA